MRLDKRQLRVDILFIMSTRSSKMWRGKELCQYLAQLGHDNPTPKQIKWVLADLVEEGVLSRTRVKPQWSLYAYKMTGVHNHNTISVAAGKEPVIRRTQEENIW